MGFQANSTKSYDSNLMPAKQTSGTFNPRTLFHSYEDYQEAERLLLGILEGKIGKIRRNNDGSIVYDDILDMLENENTYLSYLGYEHLVELFLKHNPQAFKLDGDLIVPFKACLSTKDVEPPEYLYFGTVSGVADKAANKGLSSKRHPYIILQSDFTVAEKTAESFGLESGDLPVVITIRALEAKKNGVEFLLGHREGQYMTEYVSRTYLSFPTGNK